MTTTPASRIARREASRGKKSRAPRMAPEDRRAALVEATIPLLLVHGSTVSTMNIAEAAGVAEGTIFRAFPDKDALVVACLAHVSSAQPFRERLERVPVTTPLAERVLIAVNELGAFMDKAMPVVVAVSMHGGAPPASRSLRGKMNDDTLAALEVYLRPAGDSLAVSVGEAARLLYALVIGAVMQAGPGGTRPDPKLVTQALVSGIGVHA